MTSKIVQTITISGTADRVFAVIIDLPAYNIWLPHSSSFKGTTNFIPPPPAPIAVGTRYTEPGPAGVRYGEIKEFEEPRKVVFYQPMTMSPAAVGIVIGVKVHMIVKENADAVIVERTVEVEIPWILIPLKSFIVNSFRTESWRTMEALKKFVESTSQ